MAAVNRVGNPMVMIGRYSISVYFTDFRWTMIFSSESRRKLRVNMFVPAFEAVKAEQGTQISLFSGTKKFAAKIGTNLLFNGPQYRE